MTQPLTRAQLEVLEFARAITQTPGRKEAAIFDWFRHTSTVFYQRLNALLTNPAAEEYDPQLVRRLRRVKELRRQARMGALR